MRQTLGSVSGHRGVTLTELVIAIGILLAVAAIGLPMISGYVRSQRALYAAQQIALTLDAVAVTAQRENAILAVYMEYDPQRLVSRPVDVAALGGLLLGDGEAGRDMTAAPPARSELASEPVSRAPVDELDAETIGRLLIRISESVDVSQPRDEVAIGVPGERAMSGGVEDLGSSAAASMFDATPSGESWLVAVYFADGSAARVMDLEVTSGNDTTYVVKVGAGLARSTVVERRASVAGTAMREDARGEAAMPLPPTDGEAMDGAMR